MREERAEVPVERLALEFAQGVEAGEQTGELSWERSGEESRDVREAGGEE